MNLIIYIIISDSLGSFGHFIAVPPWAVGVGFLHLGVELATVGEVVNGLEGQGGLVSRKIKRQVHCGRRKDSDVRVGKKHFYICEHESRLAQSNLSRKSLTHHGPGSRNLST